MDLKKRYDELRKKYKLPKYEHLDSEFELLYIPQVTEISFPLRFIRRRINDKLAWFCRFLEGLLQPNPSSLISLEESKFFTETKNALSLLRELMFLERQSVSLDVEPDEKKDAEFINLIYKNWGRFKKEITRFSKIIKDGWKSEIKEDRKHYFG